MSLSDMVEFNDTSGGPVVNVSNLDIDRRKHLPCIASGPNDGLMARHLSARLLTAWYIRRPD
jgi:hypothetical protein